MGVGGKVTTGPWASSSEGVKNRTHLSSSLSLGDSFPRIGLEQAIPKASRCPDQAPSFPASRISHYTEEAGRPSSGQLQSQQGPGAGMQAAGLCRGVPNRSLPPGGPFHGV